MLKGLKKCHL